MTQKQIRDGLIKAGVKNLQDFGYPCVDSSNILTDIVYKKFFVLLLKSEENINVMPQIEIARLGLLQELA